MFSNEAPFSSHMLVHRTAGDVRIYILPYIGPILLEMFKTLKDMSIVLQMISSDMSLGQRVSFQQERVSGYSVPVDKWFEYAITTSWTWTGELFYRLR